MDMTTQDYLKKALLDSQERVRDYMNYAEHVEDDRLAGFFKQCAESEGMQASKLKDFIREYQ